MPRRLCLTSSKGLPYCLRFLRMIHPEGSLSILKSNSGISSKSSQHIPTISLAEVHLLSVLPHPLPIFPLRQILISDMPASSPSPKYFKTSPTPLPLSNLLATSAIIICTARIIHPQPLSSPISFIPFRYDSHTVLRKCFTNSLTVSSEYSTPR